MKIGTKLPVKKYPYLAVWNGISDTADLKFDKVKLEDILLISIAKNQKLEDGVLVQSLFGGKESYFTKNENEYVEFPGGFKITIRQ